MASQEMIQTKILHDSELYTVVKIKKDCWKFKTKHGVETFRTKHKATELAGLWKIVEEEAPKTKKKDRRTVPPGGHTWQTKEVSTVRSQQTMSKEFITKPGDVFTIKSWKGLISNTISVNVTNEKHNEEFWLSFVNELKAWKFLKKLNRMGARTVLFQTNNDKPIPFEKSIPYISRFKD